MHAARARLDPPSIIELSGQFPCHSLHHQTRNYGNESLTPSNRLIYYNVYVKRFDLNANVGTTFHAKRLIIQEKLTLKMSAHLSYKLLLFIAIQLLITLETHLFCQPTFV